MQKQIIKILLLLALFFIAPKVSSAATLFNFDEQGADGTTWPGWTWVNGTDQNPHLAAGSLGSNGFGGFGWDSNFGSVINGNWYPRSEAKQDTGNNTLAIIDSAARAPGDVTGASMKVYDAYAGTNITGSVTSGSNVVTVTNPAGYKVGDNIMMPSVPSYNYPSSAWFPQIGAINGNQITIVRSDTALAYNANASVSNSVFRPLYLAGWWFNSGNNYNTLGMADATTNRMSMYVKVEGLDSFVGDTDLDNMDFYIGTYLCWPGGGASGDDCPKEANGTTSNHYYHYFTFNSGGWTHLLLDQSPQHNRGDAGSHIGVPDQRFAADGVHHYFQYMNNFYAQVSYPNAQPTSFWIDDVKLYTAAQTENEISVASLFVSYWPENGKTWELGFNDNSWSDNLGNDSVSTYEIRYSTSPITNENYNLALPITPTLNAKTGANAGAGRIKRPNPWKFSALTRFVLPTDVTDNNKIYFAVKDVSSVANGDGHDAASNLVKTIDFDIRPSVSDITPPAAPTSVSVQ